VDGAKARLNEAPLPTTYVSPYLLKATVAVAEVAGGGLVQVANPGTGWSKGQVLAAQEITLPPDPSELNDLFLPIIQK
jgi:hypothetical protein